MLQTAQKKTLKNTSIQSNKILLKAKHSPIKWYPLKSFDLILVFQGIV